jgi:hypothetical protein
MRIVSLAGELLVILEGLVLALLRGGGLLSKSLFVCPLILGYPTPEFCLLPCPLRLIEGTRTSSPLLV